jgi:hypothetical protein
MRIDEINLLGQFKITGNTGNNSQAIGMSGGSTSFIDVVASGGGSAGLVQRSGYNYIIVEATGDALANGVKLKDAYTDVATLFNIGTPGIDNRFSILLTPGDYNLGAGPLFVDSSFIDIVGISQNPLDTIVRASGTFSTIVFDGTMDFGLYNIDLRSGETEEQVAFYDNGGTNNTYLRMKNVVISGNGFYSSGTSFFSFYDLDGEFENITVLDGCYFAVASNSISGTYKNIKIGSVDRDFYSNVGNLSGTFKDISISNCTEYSFSSGGNISGTFENITIGSSASISFSSGGDVTGYYKNIKIFGFPGNSFTSATSNAIYEDIEISDTNTADVFYPSSSMSSVYKNIKIGNCNQSLLSSDMSGTFSNIEIGNVGNSFQGDANLTGSFKDIKVGNAGAIFLSNVDLTGTYENITIGDIDGGSCFTTNGGNISGTFKNITVGNVGATFFISAIDLSGTFENIKSGDVLSDVFLAGNSILGTFKKISVKSSVGYFFQSAGSDINGVFDDIYIGSSGTYTFYTDGGILSGTFSNIEIGNCGRSFASSGAGVSGYYDGITIGTSSQFIFSEITTGTYKNIKIGSCTSFFAVGNTLGPMSPALVENIEVGESGNFITSLDALGGTYKNVKVGFVTGNAFSADLGITGTYSNIEINSCSGDVFSVAGGNTINVNVDKLTVGTASGAFIFTGGTITGTKINKANITANFLGYDTYGEKFDGILTNSTINMIGRNDAVWVNNGSIERSKVLTDDIPGGTFTGNSLIGNGQVIYTMTNYPIGVTGATQNISDTSITS